MPGSDYLTRSLLTAGVRAARGARAARPRAAFGLVLAGAVLIAAGCGSDGADSAKGPTATPAASAKPAAIAFRRFFDADHKSGAIFVINPDGTGERQLTHPPAGSVDALSAAAAFSPDGTRMTFRRDDADENSSLWQANADGSAAHRLVAGEAGNARYSPDGRLIAFARAFGTFDRYKDLKTAMFVMNEDGTHERRLTHYPPYDSEPPAAPSWSPDGKQIVFELHNVGNGRPKDARALFLIGVDGRGMHRITDWKLNADAPDWSPDSKLILFKNLPPHADFGGDYHTIRPDGTGHRQLTHLGPAGKQTGIAAWSPDGERIVFANKGVGGNDDIYTMSADGTDITAVTHTRAWESAPSWTAARASASR